MMFLDAVLYGLLAWYLDKVRAKVMLSWFFVGSCLRTVSLVRYVSLCVPFYERLGKEGRFFCVADAS